MMNAAQLVCPLCGDAVDKLLYRFHLGSERQVIERIKQKNPEWTKQDGACSRCVDYYHTEVVIQQRILPEIGPYFPIKSADDFLILPTALRLDADPRFTGKGITICFIDSGFYPHPDLVQHSNRIKKMVDMTNPDTIYETIATEEHPANAWHGTMTSVVCAGDGYLGNGLYKGIASDAELVLIKVQDDAGKINADNIVKALEWINNNNNEYGIRIVNISLGDDQPVSWKESKIDQLAEKLIKKGIVVVAASGNTENEIIKPPANSPGVIAVGGIDDENKLGNEKKLYHSSYGKTMDDLMKPELTAPAIWIAAPILPGTKEKKESEILHELLKLTDDLFPGQLTEQISLTRLDPSILQMKDISLAKDIIRGRIQACKYISEHYMHVDGTSFAAPVVSSVIAQMLEANSSLDVAAIREILFSTAKRIKGLPAERQGFGTIQPRKAILRVLKGGGVTITSQSPRINRQQHTIRFSLVRECASEVCLSGSFNQWTPGLLQMEPVKNGIWTIEIPTPPPGKYQYKFCADNSSWIEDVNNPFREPDGFGGFNSILVIDN